MMRRLLSTSEVSEKLGFSPQWLYKARRMLESRGFPAPIFGGGRGRHARWDEAAIDRWLDLQIDGSMAAEPGIVSITRDLDRRLSSISLDDIRHRAANA